MPISNCRKILIVAVKNGTVEENLKALGYSTSVCVALRKKMGLVYCQNTPLRLIDCVEQWQNFWITFEDSIDRVIPLADIPLKIVYEDEDYAVIDKQAGLTVIANHQHYGKSLENALANVWGQFVYRPINRLDKDTSGLMVVAKNQLAHSLLSADKITRHYLALVDGIMPSSGTIDAPLGRQNVDDIAREVSSSGKPAVTHFCTKQVFESRSLVQFVLQTGRTHQIRAHCDYIGHPICCDQLYNRLCQPITCANGLTLFRQALHSCFVSFENPITHKLIQLQSDPEFV